MNWKLLAAILLGLAVGIAIPSLRWTQDAQAQRPEKVQQWEYKVFGFQGFAREGSEYHGKQLDKLSADGWEYVGLLNAGCDPRGQTLGMVAFKRPKK